MKFQVRKLNRTKINLRLALIGPSGGGKTYTSQLLARHLTDGKILVIDSERGSANRYGMEFGQDGRIDHIDLPNHSPVTYAEAIGFAADQGYSLIIIDSLSHAWSGVDGVIAQADKAAKKYQGNSLAGWRDATPMHNALVDAILSYPGHVIATMRSKTEYAISKDEKGKSMVRKIGTAPVQKDGIEFEFDIVADMDHENHFIVSKTRMADLGGAIFHRPDAKLAARIRAWADAGEEPPPVAAPVEPNPKPPVQSADHRPDVEAQAPPKAKKSPSPQSILGNAARAFFPGCTIEEAKQVMAHLAEKHGDYETAAMLYEAAKTPAHFFAGVDFKAVTGRDIPAAQEAAS